MRLKGIMDIESGFAPSKKLKLSCILRLSPNVRECNMRPCSPASIAWSQIDPAEAEYLDVDLGFDVVCFEFAKQRALVDAEIPGRAFPVALVLSQRLNDKKNLHLL